MIILIGIFIIDCSLTTSVTLQVVADRQLLSGREQLGDHKVADWFFPQQTGLKLVLTINPFISTQSENFESQKHLFVKERNSTAPLVPALTWFKVLKITFYKYIFFVYI